MKNFMKLMENKLRFEIIHVIQDSVHKKISTRIFNRVNRCLTVKLYEMGTSRYNICINITRKFKIL